MFSWAIERDRFGLTTSPCDHLRAARILGDKASRDRTLTDDELFAFWRAAGRLGYPFGPLYRLLLLTGVRLNEAADSSWPEFDLSKAIWVIPSTRMKGRNSRARAHTVPLSCDALSILDVLPRVEAQVQSGEPRRNHLFSTTAGERPVWVSSKIKERLDRRMLATLRALARQRGENPGEVSLPHWTNHDLRRTLRTGLSRLRVGADIAEAVLAHAKPGIRGVYDRFDLLDEKRQALELWSSHVRSIVSPPPTNVLTLRHASR
jgi:integrase